MAFIYGNPEAAKQAAALYGEALVRTHQEAHHTATVAEVEQHLAHFMAGGLNRDQAIVLIAYGILASPAHVPQLYQHPTLRAEAERAMARTLYTIGALPARVALEDGDG